MLRQFYGDVLPTDGAFCLFLGRTKSHIWAQSLDDLARLTNSHIDEQAVYFGTAAYKTTLNRKQDNVLSLKALRLDIDAGEKKYAKDPDGTYPNQPDAIRALMSFIKDTDLKHSYIVSRGEGLHVYFCLDEAVTPDTWLPLATGLGQLALARGLRVDPTVTTDTARILRPIGTPHSNGSRVSVIRRTGVVFGVQGLRALLPAAPVANAKRWDNASINDELSLGFDGPPSSALKVVQHCGALREVAESRGDVQEPLWRAMLGLVKHTTESIDLAHEWSSGYAGYDEDEVDRKYEAWTTGPSTCTEFAKHSTACATCQYAGKVKSPIMLGQMTAPEIEALPEEKKPAPPAPPAPTGKPWDGQLPPRYEVVDSKGKPVLVYAMETEKTTETGEVVPVVVHIPFTYDIFWFGQWAEADNSDDSAQVVLQLYSDGYVKSFLMDQTVVASTHKLLEYLASKAIHTTTHRKAGQAMQDYAKAQLQYVKANKKPKIADHLGFRILEDGQLVSAQGGHVIYPDGTIQEAMLSSNVRGVSEGVFVPLEPNVDRAWPNTVWEAGLNDKARRHVDFLRRYYSAPGLEKYQLAIMMALASPLMPFVDGAFTRGSKLPPLGLTVSLYSRETARGKTTAIKSALMAFGDADALSRDSNSRGSTALARIAKLSLHGSIPIGLDEMGDLPTLEIASLISAIGNGSGRDRATKTGGLAASNGTFSLMAIMAANKSAREMVAVAQAESDAIQFRLLELNVEDVSEFDADTQAQHRLDWAAVRADCSGALGAVIHRAVCELGVSGANALTTDCVNRAAKLIGATQSDRFQYKGLGAVLALHVLLNKLGMPIFDIKTLVSTFKDAYNAGLEFIEQNLLPTGGLDLLQRALNDLQPYTVITQFETRPSNLPGTAVPVDRILNSRMPSKVVARHIVNTNTTYLSVEALKEWCREHGIGDTDITREAKANGVFRSFGAKYGFAYPYVLLKNTGESANTRCRVYKINLARLHLCTDTPATGRRSADIVQFPVSGETAPQVEVDEPTGTQ